MNKIIEEKAEKLLDNMLDAALVPGTNPNITIPLVSGLLEAYARYREVVLAEKFAAASTKNAIERILKEGSEVKPVKKVVDLMPIVKPQPY
jgi:hypothetical protein